MGRILKNGHLGSCALSLKSDVWVVEHLLIITTEKNNSMIQSTMSLLPAAWFFDESQLQQHLAAGAISPYHAYDSFIFRPLIETLQQHD